MKKFIIRIIITLVIVLAVSLFIFFTIRGFVSCQDLSLDKNKTVLVVGDSHAACAINDDFFTRSASFAASGRSTPFSYFTTKRILRDNPQIDTVVISIGLRRLAVTSDSLSFYDKAYFCTHFSTVALYADLADLELLQNVPDFYKNLIRAPFQRKNTKFLAKTLLGADYKNAMGGYEYRTDNFLVKDLERKGSRKIEAEIDTSLISYKYLFKLKELCDEKNITLILMSMPKYKVTETHDVDKFEELRLKYLSEFNYVDFSDFPLYDSCFQDITHLNYKGAEIFSSYLQEHGVLKK